MTLVELGNLEDDANEQSKRQQSQNDEEKEEEHLEDPPPASPGTGSWTSGRRFALKAFLATIIPWLLHLIFAAVMYHIEEPHEQELLMEYAKKKTDLMILFDKCTVGNTIEEEECEMFKEKWFDLTLQLAQEDPGVENRFKLRNIFVEGEKKWTVMRSIGFAAETSSTIGKRINNVFSLYHEI